MSKQVRESNIIEVLFKFEIGEQPIVFMESKHLNYSKNISEAIRSSLKRKACPFSGAYTMQVDVSENRIVFVSFIQQANNN